MVKCNAKDKYCTEGCDDGAREHSSLFFIFILFICTNSVTSAGIKCLWCLSVGWRRNWTDLAEDDVSPGSPCIWDITYMLCHIVTEARPLEGLYVQLHAIFQFSTGFIVNSRDVWEGTLFLTHIDPFRSVLVNNAKKNNPPVSLEWALVSRQDTCQMSSKASGLESLCSRAGQWVWVL